MLPRALREGSRHRRLRSGVPLWGDGKVLKLTMRMVTRRWEHTRDHGIYTLSGRTLPVN